MNTYNEYLVQSESITKAWFYVLSNQNVVWHSAELSFNIKKLSKVEILCKEFHEFTLTLLYILPIKSFECSSCFTMMLIML